MKHPDELPRDDFAPEDWVAAVEPGSPLGELGFSDAASARFVDRVARVVADDFATIEAEAAQVDAAELPQDLLDALAVPEPSPGFIARTLWQVDNDRSAVIDEPVGWRDLLAEFTPPVPTADFVERTQRALSGSPAHSRRDSVPSRRWLAVLTAAAALVVASWLLVGGKSGAQLIPLLEDSPVRWGTAMARLGDSRAGGLRFEPIDSLTLLAETAARRIR